MDQASRFILEVNAHIINPLIGLLFTVAFVIFLWGAVTFIFNSGDTDAQKKGKQHMLWGVIGMFIMVSVVAILRIVLNTFGVDIPDTRGGGF